MVESEEVSSDGLTWTFKLRAGLKFHDGEQVLAKDVVASITRWSNRDSMGLMLKAIQKELVAVDDRTFKWVLSKPYPKMLLALGKIGTPCCFIMPERIAKTDPFKQIEEYIGSGPDEVRARRLEAGRPRGVREVRGLCAAQRAGRLVVGRQDRCSVDRIEWVIMPDPATASAALQNGEIDWWETPIPDLVPVLKKNKNIKVDIADPLGNIGAFRLNHMHPPFNNVKVRRAVQMALSQEDYMRAVVGADTNLWKPIPSFFTPGTPALHARRAASRSRASATTTAPRSCWPRPAIRGQPVTCLVAQDQPPLKAMGEITADLLKKIGMTVDFVATDWGTVGQRRASKNPPGQGGWGMFHTWHAGADCANPVGYIAIRANGEKAWFGWPDSPEVEKEVAAWFEAKSLDEEKAMIARLNKAAMEHVIYIPTGFYYGYQAWRSNLDGVGNGPLPWFWGVKKA